MALGPISPYAASNLAGEHYARAFQEPLRHAGRIPLRYLDVFAPGRGPSYDAGVISRIISILLQTMRPDPAISALASGHQPGREPELFSG